MERTHDWIWILEVYTLLGITKTSDHLPALSGLARQAKEKGWGQYVAGLWRNDLEYLASFLMKGEAIRWIADEKEEVVYLGPSWSWVGKTRGITYNGNIRSSIRQYTTPLVQIVEVETKTGLDPTGAVTDAFMRVKGRTVNAVANVENWQVQTARGLSFGGFVPDEPTTAVQGSWDIKLLPWMLSANASGGAMITMVLIKAEMRKDAFFERKGAWKRLGMFNISEQGKDFRSKEKFKVWREGTEELLVLV